MGTTGAVWTTSIREQCHTGGKVFDERVREHDVERALTEGQLHGIAHDEGQIRHVSADVQQGQSRPDRTQLPDLWASAYVQHA